MHTTGSSKPKRRAVSGVQLADEAERLLARHLHEALAARMQERVVVGRHGDDAAGDPDGAQDRLEHALAEEERCGLAGAPPGRAAEAPAHDRAERPGLARQLLALDGVVGVRDLEEREVVAAPGGVARERLEQARQQQRAQMRVLLRERIRDRQHRAARVVGGEAESVGRVRGHVRERLRLRQASPQACIGDHPAHALGRRQPAARSRPRAATARAPARRCGRSPRSRRSRA